MSGKGQTLTVTAGWSHESIEMGLKRSVRSILNERTLAVEAGGHMDRRVTGVALRGRVGCDAALDIWRSLAVRGWPNSERRGGDVHVGLRAASAEARLASFTPGRATMAVGALVASDCDGVVGACVHRTPIRAEDDLDSIVGAGLGLRGDRECGVAF